MLRALLALAVDEREQALTPDSGGVRPSRFSTRLGWDSSEIAGLIGKQAGSVRMTLSRARKGGSKTQESGDG